jgi:hypothetical protein
MPPLLIESVEERVHGQVRLSDGTAFRNPGPKPCIHLAARQTFSSDTFQAFSIFTLLLQQLEIKMEEKTICRLLAYSASLSDTMSSGGVLDMVDVLDGNHSQRGSGAAPPEIRTYLSSLARRSDITDPGYSRDKQQHPSSGTNSSQAASAATAPEKTVYFERLMLQPLKVLVTYQATVSNDPKDKLMTQMGPLVASVANLDALPFKLNALLMDNVKAPLSKLTGIVGAHYQGQAMAQSWKVFLGLQVLGNPVGLVNSLGTGVYDLFYEPAQGVVMGPMEAGHGVVKGVSSLVGNVIGGVTNTASGAVRSVSNGFAMLSMDDKFLAERRAMHSRGKSKNIAEGTFGGVKTIGTGVLDGVSGIFIKPVEGAQKGGVKGFGVGVWQGLTGAVIKPVTGVLDGVSQTVDGVQGSVLGVTSYLASGAQPDSPEQQRRLPRHIDVFGVLQTFSASEAIDRQLFLIYLLRNADGSHTSESQAAQRTEVFSVFELDNCVKVVLTQECVVEMQTNPVASGGGGAAASAASAVMGSSALAMPWTLRNKILLRDVEVVERTDQDQCAVQIRLAGGKGHTIKCGGTQRHSDAGQRLVSAVRFLLSNCSE